MQSNSANLAALQEGMQRLKQGAVGVADRVPVYGQLSHHSARLAGVSTISFFTEAETFLRCELAADALYQLDAPTIHYDVYNIESEALGAKLIWGEGQIPAIDPTAPLLPSVDAVDRLRPVKMGATARMPWVLEINQRLMDMGLGPKIRFTGIFTFAANLVGLQELLLAIATNPAGVHKLMGFLTHEIVAPWIVCQRERSGCNDTATGSDALASPPLLSVPLIREFCLRYIKELDEAVGGIRLAGLWGESCLRDPTELLEIKREGAPGAIQVLDPDASAVGPAFFREYAEKNDVGLVMGLDANLVGAGSVAEIKARARQFIEEAGRRGRFVLFINDIPYETPPANVHAVVATAHEYVADDSGTCYMRKEAR